MYDGRDHAEIVALRQAGERARGATLYVNLEPCCHTGRTGPCTKAIIAAGVARVVRRDGRSESGGRRARVSASSKRAGIEVRAGLARGRRARLERRFREMDSHGAAVRHAENAR